MEKIIFWSENCTANMHHIHIHKWINKICKLIRFSVIYCSFEIPSFSAVRLRIYAWAIVDWKYNSLEYWILRVDRCELPVIIFIYSFVLLCRLVGVCGNWMAFSWVDQAQYGIQTNSNRLHQLHSLMRFDLCFPIKSLIIGPLQKLISSRSHSRGCGFRCRMT